MGGVRTEVGERGGGGGSVRKSEVGFIEGKGGAVGLSN